MTWRPKKMSFCLRTELTYMVLDGLFWLPRGPRDYRVLGNLSNFLTTQFQAEVMTKIELA